MAISGFELHSAGGWATAVCFIDSYAPEDEGAWIGPIPWVPSQEHHLLWHTDGDVDPAFDMTESLGNHGVDRTTSSTTLAKIPFGWPVCLFLFPPALWLTAAIRRARMPRARGLCPSCGYDLRASTDRCPECGTAIQVMPISAKFRPAVASENST